MTAIHLYTQLHILQGGPSVSVWLDTSMTLVMEYQYWVYKSGWFCLKVTRLKGNFWFFEMKEEVKNMAKFEKNRKKTWTNIGLGEQLFLMTFFDNFNFWTPLFCKIGPNFCQLEIPPFPNIKFCFKPKSCYCSAQDFKKIKTNS